MIRARRALLDRIRAHARQAYPEECCGLLVGQALATGGVALTAIEPSANVTAAAARDSFEIDPGVRIRLMRRLRGSSEAIVGHYHSHPDGPAQPSARDAAAVLEADLLWLIVGVDATGSGEVAAFRFDPARRGFRRLALVVEA